MSETSADETTVPQPPTTGHTAVDAALAGLAGLDQVALADHPTRLAAAQDVLSAALEDSRQPVHNPVPQALRPQERRG